MSILNKLIDAFPDHKPPGKRWLNINCNFCEQTGRRPDRKYHLGINFKKGYVHCFRCRRVHKLSYFLKLVNIHIDLDEFENEDSEPITYFIPKKNIVEFPSEYINILDLYDPKYPTYIHALDYIDKRIGIELAVKLNIGFCDIGKYANRIIVPVFDLNDDIIYFAARAIYSFLEPKILNPFGPRRDILFNWNVAQRFSEIFITEGIFGALTVYPYGICLLGKEITDEQIFKILRSNVKIINILLDGSAMEEAYKLAHKILNLTNKIKIRVLKLRPECQPDDYDFNHILNLKVNTLFYKGSILI